MCHVLPALLSVNRTFHNKGSCHVLQTKGEQRSIPLFCHPKVLHATALQSVLREVTQHINI